MIQGGDPTGTGTGGSSLWGGRFFNFKLKFSFNDVYHTNLSHNERGIVAYANTGPDTNGSQFYITYKSLPELDGKYVVFGKVIGGFLTLDQMEKKKVDQESRPLEEITLKSVTIHSNPIAMKSLSWK
jgi:peptidyl-prolyl cis-trans isomerase-like 3